MEFPGEAKVLADLLGIINPQFRFSCYAGTEIYWFDENDKVRIITFVDGGSMFAYTKDITGLPGDWKKVDYYFLYL